MAVYDAESERLWLQLLIMEEHLEGLHEMMISPRAMIWS